MSFSATFSLEDLADLVVKMASAMIPSRPYYDYQAAFAKEICFAVVEQDPSELTALFSRQTGKTETVARTLTTLSIVLPMIANDPKGRFPMLDKFKNGLWVGIFGPVKAQAQTAFRRCMEVADGKVFKKLMEKLGLRFTDKNAMHRGISNGSFIRAWSATPTSNVEGATLHIAWMEESQDIGYVKVNKSIAPMLTATLGLMIHIGTANTMLSPFYEQIQQNERLHAEGKLKRPKHFCNDWKTVTKRNKNYALYLGTKMARNGEAWVRTDAFRMAYGCEFILERGQFMSMPRFLQLQKLGAQISRAKYNKTTLEWEGKNNVYVGIDWGKASDSTVLTFIEKRLDHFVVIEWLELNGDSYEQQKPAIIKALQRFRNRLQVVLAESNGVGDPMVDWLKAACYKAGLPCLVQGFFTTSSNKSDGYKSLLIDMVSKNGILFPGDEETQKSIEFQAFRTQLTTLEKEYKGSLLSCSHPEKEDAHDDYPDSLMMAYFAASQLTTDEIFERFYNAAS